MRISKLVFSVILATLFFTQLLLAADSLSLEVPGKTIELSIDEWEKAKDETNFAKNYLEKKAYPWHKFKRVVTVFLIPMLDNQRIYFKISDNEYLEMFVAHPGFVTARTRVDKGKYWVLCRETFNLKDYFPVDLSTYKNSEIEFQLLREHYEMEINETRHLLDSKF